MNKNHLMAETPKVGAEAQLSEGMSVVPSNNGKYIWFGYIEILNEKYRKIKVNSEGMTSKELAELDLEIEKAAEEGRLRLHKLLLPDELAKKLDISSMEPCRSNRFNMDIPVKIRPYILAAIKNSDANKLDSALKSIVSRASHQNKKNKGKYYTIF